MSGISTTRALGFQLVVELFDCDCELLDNLSALEAMLKEAVTQAGATVVNSFFHHFSPHGVSGVVIIAESHVTIHTWPEYGYSAVDVFTCGDRYIPERIKNALVTQLSAKRSEVQQVERGIL